MTFRKLALLIVTAALVSLAYKGPDILAASPGDSAANLAATLAIPGWHYTSAADKMTGGTSTRAVVMSTNSLSLGFPYQGPNRGVLIIREHPTRGTSVMVAIIKGQILCQEWQNCKIAVRFDDAEPLFFSAAEPEDHRSEIVFLSDEPSFIKLASKSKRILVQLVLYQQGRQVLEFDTHEPLVWPQGKPASKTAARATGK